MNDQQFAKRAREQEDLELFIEAHELATGEAFADLTGGETPDFTADDAEGRVVGVEITTFRFEQDARFFRRISASRLFDPEACSWLSDLVEKKSGTLTDGRWPNCDRKILVIMMVDISIVDIVAAAGLETHEPDEGGFDEIWLADRTQLDAFGAVDLFAVVHPTLQGHFATGNRGQKPYG